MRIAILTHARSTAPLASGYMLGLVADCWLRDGHAVEEVRGPRPATDADLAIAHVDLTVVPAEYGEALARYPRRANERLSDISKRRVSSQLVRRDDDWEGPVIVKTDLNCRGVPEMWILGATSGGDPWRFLPRALSLPMRLRLTAKSSPFRGYRIFASRSEVPRRWWGDERLVVDRFLPERDGALYCLRKCFLLGDRSVNTVFRSREPIVRGDTTFDPRRENPPPELLERARELGVDYGRIDYGIVEGQVVVYDVNKTPSIHGPSARVLEIARELAPGLAALGRR